VSIAHEVNQPLSGILTNASVCVRLLTAREPDIEGAIEAARRATRDAHRAPEVIARLRALFRKKGLAREPFNLNDAVAEVIALATNEVQRSKALVHADLAAEAPVVNGDRTQIQQVVLNLALNALEAMSGIDAAKRELTFQTTCESGSEVAVTVRDTGAGIAAADAERIFDPFFTTKEGGMGMGLSISRSIIENHEGRLWALPSGGAGAAFRFTLPRVLEA
jgi:C4-dicarboxylate-specific signal transduction histidine kinase